MERVETTREQTVQAQGTGGLRPRRRIAKEVLQRGQRLRNRVGVLLGLSLGVVALLSVLE